MRTGGEQASGLAKVANLLHDRGIGAVLVHEAGDVPFIRVRPDGGEIVYANGGFDLWRNGSPIAFDMSADVAAMELASEVTR